MPRAPAVKHTCPRAFRTPHSPSDHDLIRARNAAKGAVAAAANELFRLAMNLDPNTTWEGEHFQTQLQLIREQSAIVGQRHGEMNAYSNCVNKIVATETVPS